MTKIKYLKAGLLSLAALAAGCIENDIPYPVVEVGIASVSGEGFTVADIDTRAGTVTLRLDEQTDIQHVTIDAVEFSAAVHSVDLAPESVIPQIVSSEPLTGTFDLRTPIYTILSLYQDYAWSIRAEQTIERRFSVAGQIGPTEFDIENRIARAYVAMDADLSRVEVTDLKLGPADITTYSPSREELSGTSFETVRFVNVTCHGRTEKWALYVERTEVSVQLSRVDAWSGVIWLQGLGIAGRDMGFRYRSKSADGSWTAWADLPAADITVSGGSFEGRLKATPDTDYQITAVCGENETEPQACRTESTRVLENGGLEQWSAVAQSNGFEIIYPYAADAQPYWSSGNTGSAIAKETITEPTNDTRPGSTGRYAGSLQSKKATVFGIGKFAAGNLFTGKYVRTEVTNGVLTFGRSFTLRPTRLRFWIKFKGGLVNEVGKNAPAEIIKDQTRENGIVYIALGTWTKEEYGKDSKGEMVGTDDSPICIDTRDVNTFFKPNGKDVIGYGEYVMVDDIAEWRQVEIDIDYPDKSKRPTHLLIVCSSSRWGDYFTGSTQAAIVIDDLELLYD